MENHHNFSLVNCDTDSITISKPDGTAFSIEERISLLEEINGILPDLIKFEDDGYYPNIIVVKAKNYILDNGKKIKYKGSSITDQKKELALIEYVHGIIDILLNNKGNEALRSLYDKYVNEVFNITDINRWCTKKTITKVVLEGDRLHEVKVRDALNGRSFQEGDKVWLYPVLDGKKQLVKLGESQVNKKGEPKLTKNSILKMKEDWDGNIDKMHLIKRIYDTTKIFENIIDLNIFPNYALKSNQKLLANNPLITYTEINN